MGFFFMVGVFYYLFIFKLFLNGDFLGLYMSVFCVLGIVVFVYCLLFVGMWLFKCYEVFDIIEIGNVMVIIMMLKGCVLCYNVG